MFFWVILVKQNKKNKYPDIISKECVLISVPSSSSTEEQLYKIVHESIRTSEIKNIAWVCYQQPPDVVEKKLISLPFVSTNIRYIDMITHTMGLNKLNDNVNYCTSPTDYNCLLKFIDQIIEKNGRNVIVIDNLNAMMSYDLLERIIKILRVLNNRITQNKCVILYLETTGACGMQTEVAVRATMNYVLDLSKIDEDLDIAWERIKKATWRDVMTLNTPILSIMLLVMFFTVIFVISLLILVLIRK
jgi:hypothetical protein